MTIPQASPRVHPAPGELISINEHKLHMVAIGTGSPAVILEAAVMDFSPTWALVQPGVAEFTQVIAYDRAGLGWSEPSERPRNGEILVAELRMLLRIYRDNLRGLQALVKKGKEILQEVERVYP